ncbi:MAG: arsenate reductase ArsC [Bryobacterales bacterium]|jgi:arsenate reductase|nr:arsenate reductase ArsC [Bryobacterales bacterium]
MKRVLFVCIGNSCRSQMAEAFARHLGAGIWEVESAGLMPAGIIAPPVREVMAEKRIDLGDQFPKPLTWMRRQAFDLVVNMAGCPLPWEWPCPVLKWTVDDPIGQSGKVYRRVRDEIEGLVRGLLDEIRGASGA